MVYKTPFQEEDEHDADMLDQIEQGTLPADTDEEDAPEPAPSGGLDAFARAPAMDFSSYGVPAKPPKGASPTAKALDFSASGMPVKPPMPRARPREADLFDVPMPQPRPASAPKAAAVPLPTARPAGAPQADAAPQAPAPIIQPPAPLPDKAMQRSISDTGPMEQFDSAPIPAAPATEEGPGALTRGFVSGLIEGNPEMTAETLEGLSYLAPTELKDSFVNGSKEMRDLAKLNPAEYKRRAGSMWDISGFGEALTWAGEAIGQGLASSVPSIITGVGGGAAGSRVAGKPGAVVGALGGAAIPSAALNYGEVYKALKDEKIVPEKAAEYAIYGAVPMVALDTLSLGPIITRLGGLDLVKREMARAIAKRIAVEAGKGTGREGITESVQEMVKTATVSIAADKPFWTEENAKGWIESGVAGGLTGGVMGAAGGIVPDKVSPPAAPPPNSSPEEIDAFVKAAGDAPGAPPPGGPAPSDTRAQMDEFERRRAAGDIYNDKTGEWTPAPAPAEGDAAPAGEPAESAAAPVVSATERRILRKKGYLDDQIDGMSRAEADAELGEAADQGVDADGEPAAPAADFSDGAIPADGAGTRASPATVNDPLDVARASEKVNVEPSEAQKAAGNYAKGHVRWNGLNITIENPEGSIRSGTDATGQPWQSKMPAAYGYVKRSKGKDGDQVDVYLGPDHAAQTAFVIDQIDPATGKFDEHKVMVGFPDQASAEAAYDAAFSDGSGATRRAAVTPAPIADFKKWLRTGKTTEPFAAPAPAAPEQQQSADNPAAEPASDIEAQARDLADKLNDRKAVWLPPATVEHLRSTGALDAILKSGVPMENFDDQGGILIAKDKNIARTARKLKTQKIDMQAIVGGLTGAGSGKPADAQSVVQQTDQAGNVTQETAVSPGDEQTVADDMAQPDRQTNVIPVSMVLKKREEKVEAEKEAIRADVYIRAAKEHILSAGDADPSDFSDAELEEFGRGLFDDAGGNPDEFAEVPDKGEGTVINLNAKDQEVPVADALAERAGKVKEESAALDLGKVPGQHAPKRALEVAAAGNHKVMMVGDEAAIKELAAAYPSVGGSLDTLTSGDADVAIEVLPITEADRRFAMPTEAAAVILKRVNAARQHKVGGGLTSQAEKLLADAKQQIPSLDLDAVRRVAISIAALDGVDDVGRVHVAEAISYAPSAMELMAEHAEASQAGKAADFSAQAEPVNAAEPERDASKAMEDALDNIEVAVEANDRNAVMDAARAARKILADTPKAIRDADPEYWGQFGKVIAKMVKPGYVTAKQEIEGAESKSEPKRPTPDEKAESKPRLEDAGEKIGGARKDQWTAGGMQPHDLDDMSGAERDKLVTKEKVWPRPDYVAMVEDGVAPEAAYLIKAIYDELPKVPQGSNIGLDEQTQYITVLNAVRSAASKVKTVEDVRNLKAQVNEDIGGDRTRWSTNEFDAALPRRGRSISWRHPAEPRRRAYDDAARAVKAGFPNLEPWQRLYVIHEEKRWQGGEVVGVAYTPARKGDKPWRTTPVGGPYETREEAVARAKEAYEQFGNKKPGAGEEPKRPHLDNLRRIGPDVRQGRDVSSEDFVKDFGFRGVEFGNWVAGDERQKVVNLAYDALHDLARVVGVPPKALSLNGSLGISFGGRGRGGKAAAHYEPSYLAINMTKLSGAGTLAHEWAHALDHYLGEVDHPNAYGGAPRSISRWRNTNVDKSTYANPAKNLSNLAPRLNRTSQTLMQALHFRPETLDEQSARGVKSAVNRSSGLKSWEDEAEQVKDALRKGTGNTRSLNARLRKAEQQIDVWKRAAQREAKAAESAVLVHTDYYKNARKLSGSGDYWHRPNELFARAFEAYVFDRLSSEGDGHVSQYLVQGVEPDRFGEGYKGNPYPAGDERSEINAAFDQFLKALQVVEGKGGEGAKLTGKTVEDPAPIIEDTVKVPEVSAAEKKEQLETEMVALDDATDAMESGEETVNRAAVLSARFAEHLREGGEFKNILVARKMATEAGFDGDAKAVEEAMELAVVRLGREIAAGTEDPKAKFRALVDLYSRQPKLGTRTSTSMRDQAFSTPIPLAYVASRLGGIDDMEAEVIYEPTAGNGALLIEANAAPDIGAKTVIANEINPARAANLRSIGGLLKGVKADKQGFQVTEVDATDPGQAKVIQQQLDGADRVIANPPFGALRQEGESQVFDLSDIQKGYKTKEIDHAIALRALSALRDDGKAVLLLGGINKLASTKEARSDAYNGKAKREFYFTLYGRYNVTDHFTVAGELYERQGAGWPVDVIVIDGRGKSKRALPAVDVPRVLTSWDQLGGLIDADAISGRSDEQAGRAADGTADGGPGSGNVGVRARGERVSQRQSEPGEPGSVQQRPAERPVDSEPRDEGRGEPQRTERGEPQRTGAQPDAERRPSGIDDFDAAFDAGLNEIFGPQVGPKSSSDAAAKLNLWRYNGRTGYWDLVRDVTADTADQWLSTWQKDEPNSAFTVSSRKPTGKPQDDRRGQPIIGTGVVVRTKSGRETSPAPKIEATSDRKTNASIKRLDQWLLDEARKEVEGNSYQTTLLKGLDVNNFSQSDRDTVNQLLFGDPDGPRPSDIVRQETKRSAAKVAKSAAANAAESADAAMAGLVQLFGGGKTLGSGPVFDEQTYAKAKPLFEKAAEKFAAFRNDIGELVKRMIGEMQRVHGLTREALEAMRPYLRRFMEDMKAAVQKPAAPAPKAEASVAPATEQETAHQVAYTPKSSVNGLGTLVPVNMRTAIDESLASLEERVGPLDDFVAGELGYELAELGNYFAAEQVDALALAIDNLKRGKGFIIGDQTGIGKGRVNAAIIRWAVRNNFIPIFVTEKPNLYRDMFRDINDIGGLGAGFDGPLRILATNTGQNIPLSEDNSVVLRTGSAGDHGKLLNNTSTQNFFKKFDTVFTNYSQMQTVKGEETTRRQFLSRIAPKAILIFDESHNAGGQGQGAFKVKGPANRSGFARDLVQEASGVFYSSATYAKRPDVMDLYSKTDMVLAVEKLDDLAEAIASGGVPMQQVVASMLAKSGQYIRRERSFAGITYDTAVVEADREQYDGMASALAAINDFSLLVKEAAKGLDQEIKAQAQAISSDNATGSAGASSVLFTSIMHNIINQMLLAIKAGPVAQKAIEAIEAGQKPIITVANTMESFLTDFAEETGVEIGQELDIDFGQVLRKYLDRTRTLILKKPFSDVPVERKYLTDAELGEGGRAAYARALDAIEAVDLSDLPVSPIDRIKQDIAKAGYKTGEITGRGTVLDYSSAIPVLRRRSASETSIRGRIQTNTDFNSGELDAIILNQAGATGISLHASKTFKDQKQRHMMIAQPEGNIDTMMQMLGRPNRTGQVNKPTYSQLVADIPAEKRPAAVLAKKMASLNANTTASRGGALTAKDVPDFLNEYGDQIAATILMDDPWLNERLGNPVKFDENGRPDVEDAMRRLTGRIPLLPLAEQEDLYSRLEEEYASLLDQMEAAGENALEAKTLDFKAKRIERAEVVEARKGSSSPFAQPVYIEKTSVLRLGKPFSAEDLANRLAAHLGASADEVGDATAFIGSLSDENSQWGSVAKYRAIDRLGDALSEFETFKRSAIDALADPTKQEKERIKLDGIKDRWRGIYGLLRVGARLRLKTNSGNITAIVLGTDHTSKTKNPLALSSWRVTFATSDGQRELAMPFSRLFPDGKSPSEDVTAIELSPIGWEETPAQTLELFAMMQAEARTVRHIATGNLLRAYEWLNMQGQIINYTDEAGGMRQGILTPRGFDTAKHYATKSRTLSQASDIIAWVKNNPGKPLWTRDQVLRINLEHGRFFITADAAKRLGGVYYLDTKLTALTRDFYKRNGVMVAETYRSTDAELTAIVKRMIELGAVFVDDTKPKPLKTEKIEDGDEMASVGRVKRDQKTDEAIEQYRLTRQAEAQKRALIEEVRAAIRQVAGPSVAARAQVKDRVTTTNLNSGWGAAAQRGEVELAGLYAPSLDLIQVALAGNPDAVRTAYHEAWHSIEGTLNAEEVALLKRETERLRAYVARNVPELAEPIQGAEAEEVWAEAAAIYTRARDGSGSVGGIHIAVRRIFEKIREILARIRNRLAGLGFRSAEDVFEGFAQGENAARRRALPEDMRYRWWQSDRRSAASVRRRAPAPGDLMPLPETVAEAWDPAVPFRQRLSDTVDALLLTPARALWDRQIDLLRFQKASELMRGPVPESLDVYLAASLYPGKVGERMKDTVKALWEPLYDGMRTHGIGRDELHDFLYARHAPERNAAIRRIDPANDAGSGMTDDEAATVMSSLSPRRADFDAVAALVDNIVQASRDTVRREGLEADATVTAWERAYDHYVPLRGFESGTDEEMPGSPSSGRGFDVRRPESMRALGRFDRADDILTNLLDMTQRTVIRAEKNRVAKAFLRFAQANKSPYYKIGLAEKKRRIDPLTGMVEEYWVNLPTHLDRVFAAKVGGKTYYIEILHPGLIEALKSLGADKMNPLLRVMMRLTREYSRFQTAKNPEFVFTNLLRDLHDAGFTLTSEERDRFLKRYAANIVNGKALIGAILGTADKGASTTYRGWFEEWREAGGKISHYGLKDMETLRGEIERELGQRAESKGKRILMAGPRAINPINGTIVKFFEALSDVTESMTRLAVYISAREVGMTKAQAARISRNATVDFNRRGKHGTVLTALYAFANAAIQGNIRLLRVLRKSKIARRGALGIVVAGMLMTFWNMWVSDEDEDKKKAYEKRKYWERERNIIIYMPGSKTAAKIPLGYGLNVFWMMGEQIAMRSLGKVKTTEMIGNIIGTAASAFNPLGSNGSAFDLETWAKGLFPTVWRWIVELSLNSNWTGKPIHPNEMPWNEGIPKSSQHKAWTHPAAVTSADYLNRLTGGNKFKPGSVDLYPDDLEYGWNFVIGGLGRFLANTSGTINDAIDGVERPVERIPFVRRFVASDNSPSVQADAYYEKRRDEQTKARQLRAAIKARSAGRDEADADLTIEALAAELRARPSKSGRGISVPSETMFRSADSQIKELRAQEDAIRRDKSVARADRETRIRELREQMRGVMTRARAEAGAR